ncbi:MAG: glycosyltransferase [Oscillospiraceae bacterium]|jgi:tetratricopeptide (TPR) repeat protein|nr:glycosyltransferase [Oscillospiraceae bacterium]
MSKNPNQFHGNRIANRARQTASRRGAASEPVRLSQCMIVKNEEKNIERALSWAKDIVFEQIVVDTGSTDRTVEIAESMGAKVFHFEWIDDFSAAKNYAIGKARGNWIAFLDADEYFEPDSTSLIIPFLEEIERDKKIGGHIAVLSCSMLNLDDDGNNILEYTQNRIFRNLPHIRYINKIHEYLRVNVGDIVFFADGIKIMHTGYALSEAVDKHKGERNAEIIRRELEDNPDDINLKGYLAASLRQNPGSADEVLDLFSQVVESDDTPNPVVARSAYDYMVDDAMKKCDYGRAAELSERAVKMLPSSPEFHYFCGHALYKLERYDEAWEYLKSCEALCGSKYNGELFTRLTGASLDEIFSLMAKTAAQRSDMKSALEYVSMTLFQNKYRDAMLISAIKILRLTDERDDREIIDYLRTIYDYSDPRDKLFLAKCAKEAGDTVLMMTFHGMITPEEKASLAEG